MNRPAQLSPEKCRELLSAGLVGRVAVCTPQGPRIFPVNHAVVDDAIVFRTAAYTLLGTHARHGTLAFEVDHLDYERHQGWSVLAIGPGEMIDDPHELERIRSVWDPRPWAGGTRQLYVRLRWTELTGRRIGGGWTGDNEVPVRRSV